MKKIILALCISLATVITAKAQNYVLKDKTFSAAEKVETKTDYKFKDKSGKVYDIYVANTKKGKRAYIKKVSKKTGKEYRYYLPEEIYTKIS